MKSIKGRRLRESVLLFEPLEDRLPPAVTNIMPTAPSVTYQLDQGEEPQLAAWQLPFRFNYFGQQVDQVKVIAPGIIATSANATPAVSKLTQGLAQADAPMIVALDNLTWGNYELTVTRGVDSAAHQFVEFAWHDLSARVSSARFANNSSAGSLAIRLTDRADRSSGDVDVTLVYQNLGSLGVTTSTTHRAGFTSGTNHLLKQYELLGSGIAGAFADTDGIFGLSQHQFQSPAAGTYVFELRSGTMLNNMGTAGQFVELAPGITYLGAGLNPQQLDQRIAADVVAMDSINADEVSPGSANTTGLNLTGAGVKIGLWDEGQVRKTHQEFTTGQVSIENPSAPFSFHATAVAGAIAGHGIVAAAKSASYDASLLTYDWFSDFAEMSAAATLADPIVLSNHSYTEVRGWYPWNWGGSIGTLETWWGDRSISASEDKWFGLYGPIAQGLDNVMHANQNYLAVWAAGNERGNQISAAATEYAAYFSTNPGTGTLLPDPYPGALPGYYRVSRAAIPAPGPDGNGGTGFDSLADFQVAKNILVIGATTDFTDDPYLPSQPVITSYSSFGPTDDGRIRPDVLANGEGLLTPFVGSDTEYTSVSGTSLSTPTATGGLGQLVQYYRQLFAGANPKAATSRAMVIHHAFDLFGNAGTTVGPDYQSGWGMMDVRSAANFLTRVASPNVNQLADLKELSYTGTPMEFQYLADGESPFKATIVWTDPAGTVKTALDDTTPLLVNDLDLSVIAPDGTVFYPWVLDPTNPTAAATKPVTGNHIDNVEQVTFTPTQAGVYRVRIGHTGANFNQNFSLLVSGSADQRAPAINKFNVILNGNRTIDITSYFTGDNIILPWANVTGFEVEFNKAGMTVDSADMTLTALSGGTIGTTLSTSGLTNTLARWTLTNPITQKVQLNFALDGDGLVDGNDGVRDMLGQYLGDKTRLISILPGDADRNGRVDSRDLVMIRNMTGGSMIGNTIFADVDGDGDVDAQDMLLARQRLGQQL